MYWYGLALTPHSSQNTPAVRLGANRLVAFGDLAVDNGRRELGPAGSSGADCRSSPPANGGPSQLRPHGSGVSFPRASRGTGTMEFTVPLGTVEDGHLVVVPEAIESAVQEVGALFAGGNVSNAEHAGALLTLGRYLEKIERYGTSPIDRVYDRNTIDQASPRDAPSAAGDARDARARG